MARPTLYNDEIVKRANAYLDHYSDDGSVIPTLAGLSQWLGISRETIRLWMKAEDKAEFAFVVDQLMCEQERLLINNGLSGNFKAYIVKLALRHHGYYDLYKVSTETDIDMSTLSDDELAYVVAHGVLPARSVDQ